MSVSHDKQAGFNLIESLVALLVLSIGLLGISAMVGNSIRFTDTAAMQSQAVSLAYDLADKIRANQASANDYVIAAGATIATPPDCNASMCTGTQLAQTDLSDWKAKLAANLPGGDGETQVAATQATITVRWTDRETPRVFSLTMPL